MKLAIHTSSRVIVITAISATIGHARSGNILTFYLWSVVSL